jgi:hypothetical protein
MLQIQPVHDALSPEFWATLLGAIATFIAAGVALFKESILRRFNRPVLVPTLETREPFCVTAFSTVYNRQLDGSPGEIRWQGFIHYVRISVKNVGNRRAEMVEVFLVDAEIVHKDGSRRKIEGFEAGNLKWSGEPHGITHSLNPSMARYCDLGSIADPSCTTLQPYEDIPAGTATIDLSYAISGDRHRLRSPNKHELTVILSAANTDPVKYKVTVEFDGTWDQSIHVVCRGRLAVGIERI